MAAILLAPSRILRRSVVAKWQRAAELNAQVCASGSRYAQVVAGVRSSPKIARVTQRARRRVHSTPVASTGNVAPSPELTVSPIEPQLQFRVRTGMGTRCVSVRRMLRTGVREPACYAQ